MGLFEKALIGKQIDGVYADSEVTYLMLNDGTHVTIRGWIVIESMPAFPVLDAWSQLQNGQ